MLLLALRIYEYFEQRDRVFEASEFLRYFRSPLPGKEDCRPILQATVSAKLREYALQFEKAREASNNNFDPEGALYYQAVVLRSQYTGATLLAEKLGFHTGIGFFPGELHIPW